MSDLREKLEEILLDCDENYHLGIAYQERGKSIKDILTAVADAVELKIEIGDYPSDRVYHHGWQAGEKSIMEWLRRQAEDKDKESENAQATM